MELRNSSLGLFGKIVAFLTVVLFVCALTLGYFVLQGNSDGAPVDVIIQRGTPLSGVVNTLHKKHVVSVPTFFKVLLTLTQGSSRVRAGEFRFQENMNPLSALRVLYFSDPVLHQVTIPEGWNVRQVAEILAAQKLGDPNKFVKLALSKDFARKNGFTTPTLEGFLFPDTYSFSKVDSEEYILTAMVKRFKQKFDKYKEEAALKGYTVERLVTLASIVEKETGAPEERPLIASVFKNRLARGMRLQSDPTTIYGIENFDGNLTRKHLETYTPYNTYRIKGLPPGPISNPGEDAIAAVLRPADSEYLYFVSKNNGTHIFTKTYKEHAHNVEVLQKRRSGRRGNATQGP
ncbi:MAG: endolytic transglycosylase MltG [Bdellovibrionaceae bacterium]|nr:endolytic transglycosylase MltG [Bdellovibrionales bacterium]MCB9254906.1 endolytic transglycosylase MltG [Pseudobdellovibrionaceae bacterium]